MILDLTTVCVIVHVGPRSCKPIYVRANTEKTNQEEGPNGQFGPLTITNKRESLDVQVEAKQGPLKEREIYKYSV